MLIETVLNEESLYMYLMMLTHQNQKTNVMKNVDFLAQGMYQKLLKVMVQRLPIYYVEYLYHL